MAKIVKSQWEFGDLFGSEHTRRVYSVTDLTQEIRRLLEKQIGQLWVTGEITNSRAQNSGHIYFTLKDAEAQLNCVLFRGEALQQREFIQDGQKVILKGDLTVYEPRGQYQLRVVAVELQGIGALQLAFERLKKKLNAEGLFSSDRKRPIPRYPQRIGVVTSPNGAAIRDILHVIQRRQPGLEIILAPCCVQGSAAAQEIASGIRLLNAWDAGLAAETGNFTQNMFQASTPRSATALSRGIDLILVTRGGGSLEDLWAFNEEIVARAIFESALPVVSAVGHEIDFTISDFVADLRAATPSAAAELITEGCFSTRKFVSEAPRQLLASIYQRLQTEMERLAHLKQRLARLHPRRRLNENLQRLDDLHLSLLRAIKFHTRGRRSGWHVACLRLLRLRPSQILMQRRQKLEAIRSRLPEQATLRLSRLRERCARAEARLRLLSPENVLERGYSITSDSETGRVVRAAAEVCAGHKLRTRVKTGEIHSVVQTIAVPRAVS